MKAVIRLSPRDLFEAFCKHYCTRDMKAILSLFTKDALLWGTGIDEIRRGLDEVEDQLNRDWSQSNSCTFTIEDLETDQQDQNWIAGTVTAHVNIDDVSHTLMLRGTLITKREEGRNKIRFFHSSFPAANQESGQSFPNR